MDNIELLFFDTFSHEISEELNLDLVQFPKPVYISEVRIIPLGARVQADFPGGVRLGATNPSQFEIEFFVNDLSKPGASTFESLGGLEYKQNVNIQLECDRKSLPTDGLVLRGWYTTITLAVYGSLTKSLSQPPETTPPSVPPAETITIKQEESTPITPNNETPEKDPDWNIEAQTPNTSMKPELNPTPSPPVHTSPTVETQPTRTPSTEPVVKNEPQQWKEDVSPSSHKSSKRPLTPPAESLVSLSPESISAEEEEEHEDEEVEREEEESGTAEPFEPILSDEDIMADDAPPSLEFECDLISEEELHVITPPELLNLEKFDDLFDDKLDEGSIEKLRETISLLSKSVMNFIAASGQEKENFVHSCENLSSTLGNFETNMQDTKNLSEIIDAGLNVEYACSQPQPAYKVRHIKIGVRLAEALCRVSSGPDILLEVNAPHKLLSLCMRENVALPVKLAAIRAVDSALISPKIVDKFLQKDNELYKLCLVMLDTAKLARLKYSLSSLLRKIHIYECLVGISNSNDLNILELSHAFSFAPTLMAQPKRQLPASAQMEIDREQSRNPRKHLIAYFNHCQVLRHLLIMVCSPDSDKCTIKSCHRFLSVLANSKEGLLYLHSNAEVTKCLLKVLNYEEGGLGSTIAWRLQVIQCLLEIFKNQNDWMPLRKLHSFLVYSEGLKAIISVLSMDNFIDILIGCLLNNDHSEFAAELISFVIRFSDVIQIFQYRASDLLEKSRNHSVLRDVISYLSVVAVSSNWNYGNVANLVSIVKKTAEKAFIFPGELMSACRMLNYLVFPSNNDIDPIEPYIELKHKNALTQVFAADGLTALISVMNNLSQCYEQPFIHCTSLSGQKRLLLISLLSPCVKLTRAILERLVKCMATGFKNLTAVAPLLGVYCLIEALPESDETQFLLDEIIATLLIFTQAVDSDGSGNVAKSLWTQMLGEVFKMISSHPSNFVPGIKLLSKLLPPVLTLNETSLADKNRIIGLRKLWSAHLQAQANSLTETLRLLCASWNTEVLNLVSLVSKQLSDLAAPTALLVGRCLLDGILTTSLLENNLPTLALLSNLVQHAPMKATILTLTSPTARAQVKSDQKYPLVIEMMCSTIKTSADKNIHKEIMNIFETLCDYKLNLVQEGTECFEKLLSHSVPSKEPLLVIIGLLVEIIGNPAKFSQEVIQSALNILNSLVSHNYGLYHVKSCLENKPDALKSLLEFIAKDNETECKTELCEQTVRFLDNLIFCKVSERTLCLRLSQLSALISWDKNSEHPIEKIPQAQELLESLQNIDDKDDKEPIPEMLEPLLQPPDALLNQFTQRSITADLKVNNLKRSFTDIPNDNTVDLLALATELLPADFNLLNETQKMCTKIPLHYTTHLSISNSEQETRETQKPTSTPVIKTKQPFVTPMRGRNQYSNSIRGNPSIIGVGRGSDPFRSRPPNTSRPPSLHVDDFVALETCGAQPTGPTGYNKLSIRGSNQSRGIISGSRSRPWVPDGRPYLR